MGVERAVPLELDFPCGLLGRQRLLGQYRDDRLDVDRQRREHGRHSRYLERHRRDQHGLHHRVHERLHDNLDHRFNQLNRVGQLDQLEWVDRHQRVPHRGRRLHFTKLLLRSDL